VRPHRALTLGVAALAGGVATAGLTAGPDAGAVAGLLALAVLLYDASLKGSVAGSLAMGACRGLNVILGVAAAGSLRAAPPVAVGVAATVLVYIAGVTSMAEAETSGAGRGTVLVGVGAVGVAAAGVVGLLVVIAPPPAETLLAVALLVAFGAWTGRALRTAYANPEPATVGPAVGACVLGLVVLDAAFASTVGVGWGVVALVLLLPAVGLSRVFDVS
jgi:4-hydroxybenzoate polyprenyltransferase